MSATEDIFNADGTLNVEYVRWLVALAERRGWLKRSRSLTAAEQNYLLRYRKQS